MFSVGLLLQSGYEAENIPPFLLGLSQKIASFVGTPNLARKRGGINLIIMGKKDKKEKKDKKAGKRMTKKQLAEKLAAMFQFNEA